MNLKLLAIFILGCSTLNACAGNVATGDRRAESGSSSNAKIETNTNAPDAAVKDDSNTADLNESETNAAQTKQPKTVRDFFNLLPQKYFTLEGCEPQKDKNCDRARRQYVQTFLEVEDTANGYWKSGCDGAQSCLNLALFKRPDASYVVAVHTLHEGGETNYFLEYKNGKWSDISAQLVPGFSNKNVYELPRQGTTVRVFAKRVIEEGDGFQINERGERLYDLDWKNGKFVRQK